MDGRVEDWVHEGAETSLPTLSDFYHFLESHRQSVSQQRPHSGHGPMRGPGEPDVPAECEVGAGRLDSAVRRGSCGTCGHSVFTNQLRAVVDGMYHHEECLASSTGTRAHVPSKQFGSLEGALPATKTRESAATCHSIASTTIREEEGFNDSSMRSALKSTRAKVEEGPCRGAQPFTPTTARLHDDACLPTVRFSDTTMTRGCCGICEKTVFTDQLRTYSNGTYYHDACLYAVLSAKLARLDGASEIPVDDKPKKEAEGAAPLSPTSQAMEGEIARIRQQLTEHQRALSHPGEAAADINDTAERSRRDLDVTLNLDDNAHRQPAPSPSKSLIECCECLATSRTPRPFSIWHADDSKESPTPEISRAASSGAISRVTSSGVNESIIPEEFLEGLRSWDQDTNDVEEGDEEHALVESMKDLSKCLRDSAKRVKKQVLSPREFCCPSLPCVYVLVGASCAHALFQTSVNQVRLQSGFRGCNWSVMGKLLPLMPWKPSSTRSSEQKTICRVCAT